LALGVLRKGLMELTRFAVEVRYPGSPSATKADLKDLIRCGAAVRAFVRRELGLSVDT
jgi:hypothetical protein